MKRGGRWDVLSTTVEICAGLWLWNGIPVSAMRSIDRSPCVITGKRSCILDIGSTADGNWSFSLLLSCIHWLCILVGVQTVVNQLVNIYHPLDPSFNYRSTEICGG